jgi:SAM-dependent methyltransferase
MTLLELGCNQGNTTRVYAECFGKVIAIDMTEDNIKKAKKKCEEVDNVEFIVADVYDINFKLPKADVVHTDAGHTYQHVAYDIDRCIDLLDNPIFILDDYGNPKQDIKKAINDKVKQYKLKIDKFIGEKDGYICVHGLVFDDREGVIINLK